MITGNKKGFNKLNLVWLFFITLFAFVLFSFIYKGTFSRYLQDDYCYGASIVGNGFLRTQYLSYFFGGAYNGNRFALTLFSGIFDELGGVSLMPMFSAFWILLWGSTLTFLFKNIYYLVAGKKVILPAILFSEIILSFSFFLAPELFQVLYWKAGSLPYLAPLVLNTYLFSRMISMSQKEIRGIHFCEFILIGFLASGFSETTAVIQFTIWGILFINLSFCKQRISLNRKLLVLIGSVLLVTTCGLCLQAFSPSNSARLSITPAKPIALSKFLSLSFVFGMDFIKDSLKSRWLPFFILFCTGLTFGLNSAIILKNKTKLLLVGIISLSLYLICVAASTPSVLLGSVYPENRALFPSHYFLVLTIFSLGFLLSQLVSTIKPVSDHKQAVWVISVILCLGITAYMVRKLPFFYEGIPQLKARSIAWDQRNAWIISEKILGNKNILAPAFDSIAHITEINKDPEHWVNLCAARYYGIDSISAIEYFNNVKPYFQ